MSIKSDHEALVVVLGRLQADVGGLLDLIQQSILNGGQISPFWAVSRMLFPIAESIGDLKYRLGPRNTSKNLTQIINSDLASIRESYRGKGNIIAQLYRHSLIHSDLLRSIKYGNYLLDWEITLFGADSDHLKISRSSDKVLRLNFDLYVFYLDLCHLLGYLVSKSVNGQFKGELCKRYNEWEFIEFNSNSADVSQEFEILLPNIKVFIKNIDELKNIQFYKPRTLDKDWDELRGEICAKVNKADNDITINDLANFLIDNSEYGQDNDVVKSIRHFYLNFSPSLYNRTDNGVSFVRRRTVWVYIYVVVIKAPRRI